MQDDERCARSHSLAWWIVAYLISPGLAFVCLRIARAVGTFECVLGVLAGFVIHLGILSVLIKIIGDPLQIFVVLLMGVSLFTRITWQYLAGARANLWSENAKKQWRIAGRFFGGFLGIALALNIVAFHLKHAAG